MIMGRKRVSVKHIVLLGFSISLIVTVYTVGILGDAEDENDTVKFGVRPGRRPLSPATGAVVHRGRTQINGNAVNNELCRTYEGNYFLKNMVPEWKERLKNVEPNHGPSAFEKRLNDTEHRMLLNIFSVFKDVCDSNNLEFFMFGDSLLGSYRHFGIVPWGERLHVMLNSNTATKLVYLLNVMNDFECTTVNGVDWVFTQKNTSFELRIKFFQVNDEYIWDFDEYGYPIMFINKSDVFPLECSPFESFLVHVPRRMKNVLGNAIVTEKCIGHSPLDGNDPLLESIEMVPCENLYPYYPFVFESKKNGMTVRELKLNKRLISTYYVPGSE